MLHIIASLSITALFVTFFLIDRKAQKIRVAVCTQEVESVSQIEEELDITGMRQTDTYIKWLDRELATYDPPKVIETAPERDIYSEAIDALRTYHASVSMDVETVEMYALDQEKPVKTLVFCSDGQGALREEDICTCKRCNEPQYLSPYQYL